MFHLHGSNPTLPQSIKEVAVVTLVTISRVPVVDKVFEFYSYLEINKLLHPLFNKENLEKRYLISCCLLHC